MSEYICLLCLLLHFQCLPHCVLRRECDAIVCMKHKWFDVGEGDNCFVVCLARSQNSIKDLFK